MENEKTGAINQLKIQQDFHAMAYQPIHRYLQQIIPYLEQRQEVAKRKMNYTNTEPVNEQLTEMIEHLNKNILITLNINHE